MNGRAGPRSPWHNLRAGHWQSATLSLEKSIKLQAEGGDSADRLMMSIVSFRRGAKDEALEWYIRALRRMSDHPQFDPDFLSLRTEAERLLGRASSAEATAPSVSSHLRTRGFSKGPVAGRGRAERMGASFMMGVAHSRGGRALFASGRSGVWRGRCLMRFGLACRCWGPRGAGIGVGALSRSERRLSALHATAASTKTGTITVMAGRRGRVGLRGLTSLGLI